jgi:kynurenine formamidase
MSKRIDVSHTVEDEMITYKGLPGPTICDYWTHEASRQYYDEGTEFQIGKIEMVSNTGTYLDAPFHRYRHGKDISQLELSAVADLPGVVIRTTQREGRAIGLDQLRNTHVAGRAVLVHTGWDTHWGTERYFEGHPYLTAESAAYLIEEGAALVGIDSLKIDDTADGRRPVHTALLGAEIPVVEHLRRLEHLPDDGFRFFAVPVKVKGFGSFPVRAFALAP